MGMFDPRLTDVINTDPLGTIRYSPMNLEKLTKDNLIGLGRYMLMGGQSVYRSQVDANFASDVSNGVFTSTLQALVAVPATGVIAASPTYFVAGAVAGTGAAQYSTDAITWSQTSLVAPASTQVNSILFNGIRWLFGVTGSAQMCVTTGDNPNTTWTATTGGGQTSLTQGIAYSATLALSIMSPSSGTAVYSLPDGSTTCTSRTTTSSTKKAVVWSGSRFVILTQTVTAPLHFSSNGTTWTDAYCDGFSTASMTTMASDGMGTIVIGGNGLYHLLVSHDEGNNWKQVPIPFDFFMADGDSEGSAILALSRVTYLNGRFCLISNGKRLAFSRLGDSWMTEPAGARGVGQLVTNDLAYKAGTYCGVLITSAAMYSATEDMSKFRMPTLQRNAAANVAGISAIPDYPAYVKVAM